MSHGPILVTGGAGYIGSHVVLALLDAGRDVVALDDLSVGTRAMVPDGVPFYESDAGDREAVGAAIRSEGCSAVIHLAGLVLIEESIREPLLYYRHNVSATVALLDACRDTAVDRFVFSSSASVYGNAETVPIPESSPLSPTHPYGRTKLMSEQVIADACRASGMGAAMLRYFNVAGADARGRSGQTRPVAAHLIHVIAEVVAGKREALEVFGTDYDTPDGTCVRDYIHVSDLARAHVAALDRLEPAAPPLILNLGEGHGRSVREVIAATEAVTGRPLPWRDAPRRPGDPAALVADNRLALSTLDWMPTESGLERMIGSALAWESATAAADA